MSTLVAPRPVNVLKSELCSHRSRLGRPYSRLDCPLCVGRTAFANSRRDDTAAARELRKIMAIPKKQPSVRQTSPPQQCHRAYHATAHPAHSPESSPNASPSVATDESAKHPMPILEFERPMTAPRPLRLSSLTGTKTTTTTTADPTPTTADSHKIGGGLTEANLLELENFDLDNADNIVTRDRIDSWASDTSDASTYSSYSNLYYSGIGYSRSSSADSITGIYGARSPRTSFSQRFGTSPPSRAENPIALNTPFHRVDPRFDDTFAVFDQIVGRRSRGNSFNSLQQPMAMRARSGSGVGGRSRGNSRENLLVSVQTQALSSPASPGSFGRSHAMSFDGDATSTLKPVPAGGAKGRVSPNRHGSLLAPLSTRSRAVSGGTDRCSPVTVGRERTESVGSRRASVALSPKLSPAWLVPSMDGRGPSPLSLRRSNMSRSGSNTALAGMSAASASRKIAHQQKHRNYRTMPQQQQRERSGSATVGVNSAASPPGSPSPPQQQQQPPLVTRAEDDSPPLAARKTPTSPQLPRTPSPAEIVQLSKATSKITPLNKSPRNDSKKAISAVASDKTKSATLPAAISASPAPSDSTTDAEAEVGEAKTVPSSSAPAEKARKKIFGIRLPRRRNSKKNKSATLPAASSTRTSEASGSSNGTQDMSAAEGGKVETKAVSGSWKLASSLKKK